MFECTCQLFTDRSMHLLFDYEKCDCNKVSILLYHQLYYIISAIGSVLSGIDFNEKNDSAYCKAT